MTTTELLEAVQKLMAKRLGINYEVHDVQVRLVSGPRKLRVSGLATRGQTYTWSFNVDRIEELTPEQWRTVIDGCATNVESQYVKKANT